MEFLGMFGVYVSTVAGRLVETCRFRKAAVFYT
jgi:hypothetical protein